MENTTKCEKKTEEDVEVEDKKVLRNNKGEVLKRKNGRKPFWDSDNQKSNSFKYCKNHGLDFTNKDIQIAMREMYRQKTAKQFSGHPKMPDHGIGEEGIPRRAFENADRGIAPNGRRANRAIQPTIRAIIEPGVEVTENTSTSSQAAWDERIARAVDPSLKQRGNGKELPKMTNRIWKGETWNPNTGQWVRGQNGCRMDYYAWYMEFIFPSRKDSLPLGKIHEAWCEEMESDDRLLMLKPRDHYKTSLITIGYTVYQLCEHQNQFYPALIVSKADLNTKDTFQSIRDHLERNERILSFYGYMINEELSNTSELLFTLFQDVGDKDPALFCGTFGSKKVMGTHPKLAILDDIEESLLTPSYMYQAKKLLDKSLISGLPKHAKLILVGTIKGFDHTNDIYLYAKKKGTFSCYEDPACFKIDPITQVPVLDENGKRIWGIVDMKYVKWEKQQVPLLNLDGTPVLSWKGNQRMKWEIIITILEEKEKEWMSIYPERYSIIDIIRKRIEIREVDKESDDTFWSEFFLIARKPGGNYFDSKRLHHFPPRGHATTMAFLEWLHDMQVNTVCWIDPGGKNAHGIAMAVVLFWKQDIYVLDLCVIRKGVLEAAKKLARWKIMYNIGMVGCESNFEQKETFAESIDRELDLYCDKNQCRACYIPITPIHNKGDKILRIQTQMNIMLGFESTESNFWVNQDADDYQQFIDEVEMFPRILPGVASEWDLMDSVTSAKIHLESMTTSLDVIYGYN